MCGFLGYYGFNESIYKDLNRIRRASKSLEKRGPDANGTKLLGNCLMHHNRLSIIDTSEQSNQPRKERAAFDS